MLKAMVTARSEPTTSRRPLTISVSTGGRNQINIGATSVRNRGPYDHPAHHDGKVDTSSQ